VTGGGEPGVREDGSDTLRGSLLLAATRLIAALPEAPLVAAAESIGELWYRTSPGRAAQARANLRRVCEGLDAQGRGTGLARRAATDPAALETLVRRSFRHAVRYYVEVAQTGSITLDEALARMDLETPDTVDEAVRSGRPIMLLGMHYGAIELPVLFVFGMVGHRVTAPMETVGDPALQRWFETTRSRVGVNIVPLRGARHALLAAARRGESIGMVNDRDLTGTGIPVPFFGAPAPMSPGPALLAVETGFPVYVGSARRTTGGRYAGKLIRVHAPSEGTRRERVVALTHAITAAFETILADGPEQWWGVFHPIWPDLAITDAPAAGDREAAA
jgi:KDO2-lipid IV(A) lauroyltransferase